MIRASILDPRHIRGTAIEFHISEVHSENSWQHPLPAKTTLVFGELGKSDRSDRQSDVMNVSEIFDVKDPYFRKRIEQFFPAEQSFVWNFDSTLPPR